MEILPLEYRGFRQCPACDEVFKFSAGHKCDKRIEDTEWFNWVLSEFRRADDIEDPKEADLVRLTAKTIFDKRIPNYG